jgi:hypothetical protein
MQTWMVHMRRPLRLTREMGWLPALSFQVVLAGQLASVFVFAPSLLLLIAQAAGLLPLLADRAFVDDLLLAASLVAFATGVVGAIVLAGRVATRGSAMRRRRRVRFLDLATMPLYWCLMSLAAYRALGELVVAPHRWNKTDHGRADRASDEADPHHDGAGGS